MANKAISELPQAQNVNNQDLFVLEQSGIAKKLPAETFITEQGIINALATALDGHGGISSVTLSSVSGRIRTYRITFTDQSATTFQVYDGTSIDRISRTSSSGLDDVYTIFLSDGTTTFFTVHNGADGTVSEAMLNDALKNKAPAITETTESSAIANFTDGADDMPMHNILAEINPVQDLTYGDPYPAGSGKNKLEPIGAKSVTNNGITFTSNGDGTYSVSGTSTSGSATCSLYYSEQVPIKAGTYYLNVLNNAVPSVTVGFYMFANSVRVWDVVLNTTNRQAQVTVPSDINATALQIYVATAGTVNFTLSPVLSTDSYASTFTPYSNICPITGWTGCNVTRTGVNIWDEEWELGYIAPSTGAKMDATNRIRSKNYIPVVGGQSYFIKMYGAAACYDRNKSYISSVPYTTIPSTGYALNIPENARYILFSMSAPYGTTYNHDISINYPSSDYDYHAYQGSNTVTVDWQTEAGTVYGGTIDVATGLLTVTWAMITINGSTSLQVNGATANTSKFGVFVTGKANGRANILSNLFAYPVGAIDVVGVVIGRDGNNFVEFSLPHDVAQTKAAGQAWFADNPTQLCYELATPQTYQLTPQEVKTLLGTNNVWTDTGDTSVTYTADTKMFIEKLTMPTEDDMVANQAITSGKYFMIGNSLYLALANIASGAQITIGTNAQRVSLADALNTINS